MGSQYENQCVMKGTTSNPAMGQAIHNSSSSQFTDDSHSGVTKVSSEMQM